MQNTDPRVTAYIQNAAPFAQPILTHLRQVVHAACPEVTETIKWIYPHFQYNGIVCSIAAFKNHCTLNFWKASSLSDPHNLFTKVGNTAMGQFGQIKTLADLPADDILTAYIQEAVKLNKDKTKGAPKTKPSVTPDLIVPEYFLAALTQNGQAQGTFEKFSYSNKKEYVSWITEAKSDETRQKRMNTALEWLAEGKVRNWKYLKK